MLQKIILTSPKKGYKLMKLLQSMDTRFLGYPLLNVN